MRGLTDASKWLVETWHQWTILEAATNSWMSSPKQRGCAAAAGASVAVLLVRPHRRCCPLKGPALVTDNAEDFTEAAAGFLPEAHLNLATVIEAIRSLRHSVQDEHEASERANAVQAQPMPQPAVDEALFFDDEPAPAPVPQPAAAGELSGDTAFCLESFPSVKPADVKSLLKQVRSDPSPPFCTFCTFCTPPPPPSTQSARAGMACLHMLRLWTACVRTTKSRLTIGGGVSGLVSRCFGLGFASTAARSTIGSSTG